MRKSEPRVGCGSATSQGLMRCSGPARSAMNRRQGSRTSASYRALLAWNHSRLLFLFSCFKNRNSSSLKYLLPIIFIVNSRFVVKWPSMLASYAVRAEDSRGRRHAEPPHPYRNPFQRDRDRVIHARAFRRLEAKTQVFTRRFSDHFRNRLTHTIEVAQVSRTIATQLGLNVDLVEALALVHDIGHPPFGHAGEKALDAAMRTRGSAFDHNLHALRIVEDFEQRYAAL